MTPTFENWLVEQCRREDQIGALAQLWLSDSNKWSSSGASEWLRAKGAEVHWRDVVAGAFREFAATVGSSQNMPQWSVFSSWLKSPEHNEKLRKSAEYHRAHPEETPDVYLHRKRLGLLKALGNRALIYLDTNHWVKLRHVFLKNPQASQTYADIFRVLNNLAEQGRLLCPVSFPLFLELMKQSDPQTRLATALLMDSFSGRVFFQFPPDIEKWELRQRMLTLVLKDACPPLSEQVWTMAGYVGGELLPHLHELSATENDFLQKMWIDDMWELPLRCFAEAEPAEVLTRPFDDIAAATNVDAEWYRSSKLSYRQILEREKAFLLRRRLDDLKLIAKEIWETCPQPRDVRCDTPDSSEPHDIWCIPSLQVRAGITAAMIADKTWSFSSNDILDLQHAAFAIPYYDALFCDGAMSHILRSKQLELDKIYETTVLSKPEEILTYLKNL